MMKRVDVDWEKEVQDVQKLIDVKDFLSRFYKEYDFLYEHNANNSYVCGQREATDEFDENMKRSVRFNAFVGACARNREPFPDIFSSDRECAAFMFALKPEEETILAKY